MLVNEDNVNPFSVAPIVEFAKYANENALVIHFHLTHSHLGFQEIGGPEVYRCRCRYY